MSFTGTDTVPALKFINDYYGMNDPSYLVGGSVPATEHSVMSMGGDANELDTFRRLITEIYPNAVVSIVSDTWDFWQVMTKYLPALKEEILARNGRVVIRPDSGDPVKIICGDNETPKSFLTEAQQKGAYQLLWEVFGGEINEKGYKVLNPKVGLIYGDSITMERQVEIMQRLEAKGFSASNLVLGIGSFTYEYVTRDTYGFAMKATWGQINGTPKDIFKNPKTDSGFKKSARGLLAVHTNESGDLYLKDNCTVEEEKFGLLKTVFSDGMLCRRTNIEEIRRRVNSAIKS
jgi:nicotinamide phosphoribosyltransferase